MSDASNLKQQRTCRGSCIGGGGSGDDDVWSHCIKIMLRHFLCESQKMLHLPGHFRQLILLMQSKVYVKGAYGRG